MKTRNIMALPCLLVTLIGSTAACTKHRTNSTCSAANKDSMEIVNHNDSVISIYENKVGRNATDLINTLKFANGIDKNAHVKRYDNAKKNLKLMKDKKDSVNRLSLKYELIKDNNNVEHCYIMETPVSKSKSAAVAPKGVLF